jgi:hypothetical protein
MYISNSLLPGQTLHAVLVFETDDRGNKSFNKYIDLAEVPRKMPNTRRVTKYQYVGHRSGTISGNNVNGNTGTKLITADYRPEYNDIIAIYDSMDDLLKMIDLIEEEQDEDDEDDDYFR